MNEFTNSHETEVEFTPPTEQYRRSFKDLLIKISQDFGHITTLSC